MRKTRMNERFRAQMLKLAKDLVRVPEQEAERAAEVALMTAMHAEIDGLWPASDMEILRRYNSTTMTDQVRVRTERGEMWINLDRAREFPCSRPSALVLNSDHAIVKLEATLHRAKLAAKSAREVVLRDYRSLITHTRYVEDVVAVWPEASRAVGAAETTALVPLSTDAIERIRADVASRVA